MKNCKWYKRLINLIVDILIIQLITVLFQIVCNYLNLNLNKFILIFDNVKFYYWMFILFIIVFILYYFFFEFFIGRTVGKIITGTCVVREKEEKNIYTDILKRTLSRLILIEVFWFFKNEPRGLHDFLSNTRVVNFAELWRKVPR